MTDEIDLDALEQNIQESLDEAETVEEVVEEATEDTEEVAETEEAEETFDLDAALNSDQPIALAGRLTDEEAKEEAAKRGWKEEGQDRYGHKISAIEFLERAPLFNKIGMMRNDIDSQNKRIEALAEQNKKIAQKSVEDKKKLNEDLKAAKDKLLSAEYLDTEDVAKLKDIDKQIEDTAVVETTDRGLSPEDEQLASDWDKAKEKFAEDNEWYEDNYKMTKLADETAIAYVNQYLATHDGVLPPPDEALNHTLAEVRKVYPEEKKPRQTRVASTQNRTVVSQIKKTKTLADIPEDQRVVAKEVMEAAGLSEDEYLKTYEQ